MASAKLLREKHEANVALYRAHHGSVLALKDALHNDVLPEIAEELPLDECSLHRAREWIDDDGSIFRMLKKHKFCIANARIALRETLRWRISDLAPLQTTTTGSLAPLVQCLPRDAKDTVGRPVLLIKLAGLSGAPEDTKREILREYDAMRMRLYQLQGCDIFQCLIMVDFKDANIRSMPIELVPWFIREVAPRFPGMCAGVLMVNYTWAYAGVYNLVKRLLPSTVLERITFPTQSELLSHFERSCLPREYGGELDISSPSLVDTHTVLQTSPPHKTPRHYVPPPHLNLAAYLPSMSLLNPFYGYPAIANPGSSTPQLKNGRRRKRDLARTLVLLWLAKLKRTADKTWLWIIMTLILWIAELRR